MKPVPKRLDQFPLHYKMLQGVVKRLIRITKALHFVLLSLEHSCRSSILSTAEHPDVKVVDPAQGMWSSVSKDIILVRCRELPSNQYIPVKGHSKDPYD